VAVGAHETVRPKRTIIANAKRLIFSSGVAHLPNWKGIALNAVAGRNAAKLNVAVQDNIARRIVALRVFGVRAEWNFMADRNVLHFLCVSE
jgi:hypothetical protein